YMPRNQGPWTRNYEFFTSENGRAWTQAAAGEFGNIKNNPVLQTVKFEPRKARYFKFVSKTEADGQPFTCVAELGVLVK
ncbi:MAG: discoidin domain-containing protein, partial [bacterium]